MASSPQVEELQGRLEKEASRSSQLERVNGDLKEQLASTRGLGRSHERLERNNRQLEEELASLRRQAEAGALDQSQADTYRRDAEERARQEVRQKLEEVNLFLQVGARPWASDITALYQYGFTCVCKFYITYCYVEIKHTNTQTKSKITDGNISLTDDST